MKIGAVFGVGVGAGFEIWRKFDEGGTPVTTDSSEVEESTVLAIVELSDGEIVGDAFGSDAKTRLRGLQ